MLTKLKQQRAFHLMLIPSVILVFIYSYLPLYGMIIAFQDYNPGLGFKSHWVGMDNFEHVFRQPNFVRTIWNTLYMSFFKLIGGIVVPVIFALLLNEVARAALKRSFQTLVYVPNFLSWVIMAGIMIDILGSDGIVNSLFVFLGAEPISFLGSPSMFPWTMIVTDIWKGFGFGTVVYLAALTSIDPGLYEAALIDGAKRWKQTIYITLPLLMPTIILMTVLSLGNILNAGFDQIFNLYSPVVYETGDIIDTYVYRLGIQQAQYSVGAAVGFFKSIVSCILLVLSYILAYRVAGYRIF
ncbi:ABC transporter permease [Paenibacillus harenae]|uniref:Aldouronate transport system permease protein n=1 Tax=Paenibacillus harenae TaxID=306543 RepID=A0ABT9U1L5_PAEHA|nr:ABC transporter permease subunit [Paenibacillus harenae]MDQ0061893.1 putative aldouronate transport system permease protein [Paenibacillus harenae]MDQ0113518.1 putative aldouronate transport system permease protein [Paenibacillus harenae]